MEGYTTDFLPTALAYIGGSAIPLALPLTLKDLSKIREFEEVGMGGYKVADVPLVSIRYHFCSALALYLPSRNLVGLSHTKPTDSSFSLIEAMIKDMGNNPKELRGIIIVANNGRDSLEEYCNFREIKVVDIFKIEDASCERDVIVNPISRQVVIYTETRWSKYALRLSIFNRKIVKSF